MAQKLDAAVRPGQPREQAERFVRHVLANYEPVHGETESEVEQNILALLARVPLGAKLVLILDSPRIRVRHDALHVWAPRKAYNAQVQALMASIHFATAVNFDDCILDEEEIQPGGNHFDRKVYLRMSEAIVAALGRLLPKTADMDRAIRGRTEKVA